MFSKRAEQCQHLIQAVLARIWQSPGKSVRINDLDTRTRVTSCAGTQGDLGGLVGTRRGNMTKSDNAWSNQPLLKSDIISPWKESWWKFAVATYWWLPWIVVTKVFFLWQMSSPDPLFVLFLRQLYKQHTLEGFIQHFNDLFTSISWLKKHA